MYYYLKLENYIKNNLGINYYKINFTEKGAIPLFHPLNKNNKKTVYIGSAGGMTRLSTGYTFLNIQEHSKYIVENIDKIEKIKMYNIGKKYQFLDKIFLAFYLDDFLVLLKKLCLKTDIFFLYGTFLFFQYHRYV